MLEPTLSLVQISAGGGPPSTGIDQTTRTLTRVPKFHSQDAFECIFKKMTDTIKATLISEFRENQYTYYPLLLLASVFCP
jgi:hypothetical protein